MESVCVREKDKRMVERVDDGREKKSADEMAWSLTVQRSSADEKVTPCRWAVLTAHAVRRHHTGVLCRYCMSTGTKSGTHCSPRLQAVIVGRCGTTTSVHDYRNSVAKRFQALGLKEERQVGTIHMIESFTLKKLLNAIIQRWEPSY